MPSEVGSEIGHENAKVIDIIVGADRKAVDLLFASNMPQLRRAAAWIFPDSDDFEDAVVIQLMDIDGFSQKEAAQKLGISSSALKARHHRARQSIMRKMQAPR
jgi:sigma-70-like protein